ncbi:L,D-transpeptidase [Streptomyces sp. NPDC015661]|uniref:L,D-transpeptidase n=1 Tax=Streptomyces sp. NPDC015661 TaxID=3364961 RepID=UPI0036FC9092
MTRGPAARRILCASVPAGEPIPPLHRPLRHLADDGTYAHVAPWNEGRFGRVNASHGCIGMSDADAKWFYDRMNYGDPVTVVDSLDTVATDNGYGAWNVDWTTWRKGSTLS